MIRFGLIGKTLQHSFSKDYFTQFFNHKEIDAEYVNLEFASSQLLLDADLAEFAGLNITLPYKETALQLVSNTSQAAKAIGAINTIVYSKNERIGHNTDYIGFSKALTAAFGAHVKFKKAAILGSGGSSKAVAYALHLMGIEKDIVSRKPTKSQVSYELLNATLKSYDLIVNTTPLGMFPHVSTVAPIDISLLGPSHFIFDLIYNPEQSELLTLAKARGAKTSNGKAMLIAQAEASWELWSTH